MSVRLYDLVEQLEVIIYAKSSMFDWRLTEFWICLCIFLSKNFIYAFREGSLVRKKNWRIQEWILATVWWNFAKETISFTKIKLK